MKTIKKMPKRQRQFVFYQKKKNNMNTLNIKKVPKDQMML